MNQAMLDQLLGTAPPSTVDVEAVVRRTRRRRRIRHLAAGGSAAVAVVAVMVGASLLPGRGSKPPPAPPAAVASPSLSPSVSPSPLAFQLQSGTPAGQQRILDRLQTVLEEAATEHAPDVRWIYMPDVPGEKRTPDGHPVMFALDDSTFRARSGVTADGRKGGFYLSLRDVRCGAGQSCEPLYECAPPIADCQTTRTASGLRLIRYVDKPGRGWHFYGVDVELADRRHAVHLSAVNYFGGDGSAPSAPAPVFTRAQLDAIATDIAEKITG
ncbi:hypothetical protein AB0C29_02455 [Actinoplanes sp. NPDC048791]|uniref:hypothetical protein n=1 Tax=Actinoplanes sp. NPDC048791 TaxID=3154623 RepID=UPI0033D86E10